MKLLKYDTPEYSFYVYKRASLKKLPIDWIEIELIDRTYNPNIKLTWDNGSWFLSVYENDIKSIELAKKHMSIGGINSFKWVIGNLIEKGWLPAYSRMKII